MYTVYILRSKIYKEKLYIGVTEDFVKRILVHNKGKVSYSRQYCPWEIEIMIELKHKKVAYNLEKYLKSGSGHAFLKKHLLP